jgi:pyrophosphatase PpaX
MKSIKALLFDLDGTLLDSKRAVVEAVYQTANHYAPGKLSYDEIGARFGASWESFVSLLGDFDKDAVIETFMKFVKERHDDLVTPFSGVTDYLVLLRNEGFRLAVVTNNKWSLALRGLRLYEIDSLFEAIVTIDDVQQGKPEPESIIKACRELRIDKREAMMIGDSIYDVKAAHAAGIPCAVIDWHKSYCNTQWLPDYYFYNMDELTDLLIQSQKQIAV